MPCKHIGLLSSSSFLQQRLKTPLSVCQFYFICPTVFFVTKVTLFNNALSLLFLSSSRYLLIWFPTLVSKSNCRLSCVLALERRHTNTTKTWTVYENSHPAWHWRRGVGCAGGVWGVGRNGHLLDVEDQPKTPWPPKKRLREEWRTTTWAPLLTDCQVFLLSLNRDWRRRRMSSGTASLTHSLETYTYT